MPKPIGIDREQVRATFIATGSLKEAATLHGVKEATVRQWAKRYNWETVTNANKLRKKADQIIELKREKRHDDVPVVSLASDALATHMNNSHTTFKTNIASVLSRSSEALGEMDGFTALDYSRKVLDLANAAAKIFPEMADDGRIQVNILGLGVEGLGMAEPRSIGASA